MVREKKRILIVLTCLLVIIPFFLVSGTFNGRKGSQTFSYTLHEPIEISSDTELAINAVMGSGNETDPFILEGWQINAKGYKYGIHIQNTTSHFIIRNCRIEADSSPTDSGIFIEKVSPGTVTVANNVIERCWRGIIIKDINSTTILNNTVRFNGAYGISYYGYYDYLGNDTDPSTYYAIIENNIVNQNFHIGIYLSHIKNSSIIGNLISDNKGWGLYYSRGSFNQFKTNSFIHNKDKVELNYNYFDLFSYFIPDHPNFLTETFSGNYWSDYDGIGNYTVWTNWNEDIKVVDLTPLLESPHHYIPPKMYILELFILLLFLIVVGVIGGVIIVKTLPQVVKNEITVKNLYINIIRSGLAILLIQNTMILIFVFSLLTNFAIHEIEFLRFSIFHFDLLGFSVLATGYIFYAVHSAEEKKFYLLGGGFLFGWVICRVITQYIIPFGLVLHEYSESLNYQTFALYMIYRGVYERYYSLDFPIEDYYGFNSPPLIMILIFILSGLVLYLAARNLPQIRDNNGIILFRVYGIAIAILAIILSVIYYQEQNVIGLITFNILTTQVSLLVKVIIIPILGIITFGYMFREISFLKGRNQVEKTELKDV